MKKLIAVAACIASLGVAASAQAGPIALQYGSGVLKWRKVQIRSL